jgi:hypothetical protein
MVSLVLKFHVCIGNGLLEPCRRRNVPVQIKPVNKLAVVKACCSKILLGLYKDIMRYDSFAPSVFQIEI